MRHAHHSKLFAECSAPAPIALYRTKNLKPAQKLAQLFVAWFIPIISARLALHLLAEQEHDIAAIPQKWAPNETINYMY
jgi:hypothetical protein